MYDGQTKWMYVLIENDDLIEKYNTIWDKVSADIKKEFDSKPDYNKKYLKTKIKNITQKLVHKCYSKSDLQTLLKIYP